MSTALEPHPRSLPSYIMAMLYGRFIKNSFGGMGMGASGTGTQPEGGRQNTSEHHIRREKTAMQRYHCSRPVGLALASGVITRETSVFDYGCGRGGDIEYLQKREIPVSGWDPHYRPDAEHKSADVVNLGYVLNVIEDPQERLHVLHEAYELARKALIVSVRVDKSLEDGGMVWGDGYLTDAGTFQKLYTQQEFREYLQGVLEKTPQVAGLGIAYIFKDPDIESRFIANRAFTHRLEYRTDLIDEFSKHPLAKDFVELAHKLGRVPLAEEFEQHDELLETFGSPQRVERLLLSQVDRETFEGSRTERRDDVLTYISMLFLQGLRPPAFNTLPLSVQQDIKTIWGNYKLAIEEGREFLFSIGKPEVVRAACKCSTVGKLLPTDLYIHQSAEDDIPALLRVIVFAARNVVGEVEYDIIKISTDGRAVSFLRYDDFDGQAHPGLTHSLRVYLPRANYEIRHYGKSDNRPIIHRKDTLVTESYPHFKKFRSLTASEERKGLLSANDIGHEQGWKELLAAKGLEIRGHRVFRVRGGK